MDKTDVVYIGSDVAQEVMFPSCPRVGMLQERLESRSSFSKSGRTTLARSQHQNKK